MFVNSPNQPIEFSTLSPEAATAAAERMTVRRRHRAGTRRVVRPNIVRLVPGLTRLPLGPGGQPA
jgi:hypothetical protein